MPHICSQRSCVQAGHLLPGFSLPRGNPCVWCPVPATGEELRIVVAGYIRPEANFDSLDALIQRIHTDADITREALTDARLVPLQFDPFLQDCSV